jgi:monoamine oxidase
MAAADTDVIVIGAGVAGLAAAARLAGAGRRVQILEARSRMGGRIWTERPTGWPAPIELGAEFVHTGNAALKRWLRRSRVATRPVDEMEWLARDGSLWPAPDGWDRVNAVMRRIGPRFRGSFAAWLERHGSGLAPDDRLLATSFVRGFQGAPPDRMSARALYRASFTEEEQLRPRHGYTRLVEAMARVLEREGVEVRLAAPVRRIRWHRGAVSVETAVGAWSAPVALVTVPPAVLRAAPGSPGTIAFRPQLVAKQRCWAAMEPGHARRVVFRLRGDAWRRGPIPAALRRRSGHAFGFLQSAAEDFPVWWAEAPQPMLVGWTGGPAAAAMAGLPDEEVFRRAEATLAALWQVEPLRLRRAILDRRTYDWSGDVYTRGAYSFAIAGGEKLPREAARPVQGTLFFAGEATADLLELGTVHGAIASGERAAREILAR